jgi:hypothetical protein
MPDLALTGDVGVKGGATYLDGEFGGWLRPRRGGSGFQS